MKPRESVYERTRRMGFIAGPKNRMAAAVDMGEKSKPTPGKPVSGEEVEEEAAPPNLRDAMETMDSCGSCAHASMPDGGEELKGMQCGKYKCDVQSSDVCDDYSDEVAPEVDKESEEAPEEETE